MKRIAVINKGIGFLKYKIGYLFHNISPLSSQLRTLRTGKVMIRCIGAVVIHKFICIGAVVIHKFIVLHAQYIHTS